MALKTLWAMPMNGLPAKRQPGPPPKLDWLPLADLVIDDTFQRPVVRRGEETIRNIARNFSWAKFSPVIVLPLPGARFSIIDGQHRSIAALSLGYERVPCCIIRATPEEAAGIFAAINGVVTPMTIQALYKASAAAGVDWAVKVRDVAARHGVTPLVYPVPSAKQKPLMTNAIGSLRRVVERHGAATLDAVLACLVAAQDAQAPGFLQSTLIRGYGGVFAERRLWVDDPSLAIRRFSEHVVSTMPMIEMVRIVDRAYGSGRTGWADTLRAVEDCRQRKFTPSQTASRLRIPYADVIEALGELQPQQIATAKADAGDA